MVLFRKLKWKIYYLYNFCGVTIFRNSANENNLEICYMVYHTSNWIGWNYALEEKLDICVGYGLDLIEKIRIATSYAIIIIILKVYKVMITKV